MHKRRFMYCNIIKVWLYFIKIFCRMDILSNELQTHKPTNKNKEISLKIASFVRKSPFYTATTLHQLCMINEYIFWLYYDCSIIVIVIHSTLYLYIIFISSCFVHTKNRTCVLNVVRNILNYIASVILMPDKRYMYMFCY